MTWQEDLEIAIAVTKHERFRVLCADDHPDHEAHRAYISRTYGSGSFPSVAQQAGNLAGTVGRAIVAVATGSHVMTTAEERDRRWSICVACDQLVSERCLKCGCYMRVKVGLATEKCPIGKW